VLKTTVLSTLVTITMTSEVENSKTPYYIMIFSHGNFLYHYYNVMICLAYTVMG